MNKLSDYAEIVRKNVPMSSLTWLRIGGPIEYLANPRSEKELLGLLSACALEGVQVRALGDGSSILASDVGVPGMAIQLDAEPFCQIEFDSPFVVAGAGAKLGRLATATASAGLAGLEGMVGIPGSVGAALVSNATTLDAAIEQCVESARVATLSGEILELSKDELVFGRRVSNLSGAIALSVKFKLVPDDAEELSKRLQKIWIARKKTRPELDQGGFARMFKNPGAQRAADIIEEIGFPGTRIGGASVCESDPNLIVASDGCSSDDVKRLVALIEKQANERAGVELERELFIW